MGGKRAAHPYGIVELEVPLSCNKSKSKPNTKRTSTKQLGVEKTTTTVYTQISFLEVQVYSFPRGRHKFKEFLDNNTGRFSSKEEVTYKSTFKVDDGLQGFLNEVQTQVKFKKAPTSTKNNTTKCSNKHIMFDF